MKLIDKYISAKFWRFFFAACIAFIMIFVIVDLVENLDKYIDKGAKAGDVALYYIYFIPYIVILVIPIGTLLATAFLGGYLVKNRELVALRASGISTLRAASTLILWGLAIGCASFAAGEFIMPTANSLREDLYRTKIIQRKRRSKIQNNDLFYIAEDGAIYYFRSLNIKSNLGRDVVIQRFVNGELIERIDARRIKWTGFGWRLTDAIKRRFTPEGEVVQQFAELEIKIPESPDDFARKIPRPDEMGFLELRKFIARIRRSGIEPKREMTDLWMKFAFPLVSLIVVILGIPLAFKQRKGSYIYGFGQSFFVAFLYLGALRAGQAFGYNGTLPPMLAAFSGDIIFGSAGIIMLWLHRD